MNVFSALTRHRVNEVFTPRKTDVNRDVYIDRPDLERSLRRAIEGTMHVVVFGESGSGKSWLYKKVLDDVGAHVSVANSASAQRNGSLTNEIRISCGLAGNRILTGMAEKMEAKVSVIAASGGLESQRQYAVVGDDPLLEAFETKRKLAGNRHAIIVIDNLELIISSETLMHELASIITLLDDTRFAKHNVKLLLVGVPSMVRDYFAKTPATQSVANRLTEVSEVAALHSSQVSELVEKGFVKLLKVTITPEDLETWKRHVMNVTMGYAQAVQEYCEQLGYIVEDADWRGDIAQLARADNEWLRQGLSSASVAVTQRMNVRETKAGRRNQVLYVLGQIGRGSFTVAEIEAEVRREFPDSTAETTLAIGQIMSELATGDSPIIKLTPGGASYEFKNARYAMALRVLIEKEPDRERVRRVSAAPRAG